MENQKRYDFMNSLKTAAEVSNTPKVSNHVGQVSEKRQGKSKEDEEHLTEKELLFKVKNARNIEEVVQILKEDDFISYLKQSRKNLNVPVLNENVTLGKTDLNKTIMARIKEMYKTKLSAQMSHDELLEMANEFKEIRCIQEETKFSDGQELREISNKIGDRLLQEEVVTLPTDNGFIRGALREQFMTAGYVEAGELHGNHIEEMELTEVEGDGLTDYYLFEKGEEELRILSILSATERVASRMDMHKYTGIEMQADFTPEDLKTIEQQASKLTSKEKNPPMKSMYRETPKIVEIREKMQHRYTNREDLDDDGVEIRPIA